jgi:hypothetical protein
VQGNVGVAAGAVGEGCCWEVLVCCIWQPLVLLHSCYSTRKQDAACAAVAAAAAVFTTVKRCIKDGVVFSFWEGVLVWGWGAILTAVTVLSLV